jgi:hypothetical protein
MTMTNPRFAFTQLSWTQLWIVAAVLFLASALAAVLLTAGVEARSAAVTVPAAAPAPAPTPAVAAPIVPPAAVSGPAGAAPWATSTPTAAPGNPAPASAASARAIEQPAVAPARVPAASRDRSGVRAPSSAGPANGTDTTPSGRSSTGEQANKAEKSDDKGGKKGK